MSYLSSHKLGKAYLDGNQSHWVFSDVSLAVEPGEILAIVGRSGSGKSTLLHCLSGLESVSEGKLYWQDQLVGSYSASQRRAFYQYNMGFLYQLHYLLMDLTAFENVLLPLGPLGLSQRDMEKRVCTLLDEMGLLPLKSQKVMHLSGGERQRVALARALVHEPKWVFADEPTASLDIENRDRMMALIQQYQKEKGVAFIIATHDETLAKMANCQLDLGKGG